MRRRPLLLIGVVVVLIAAAVGGTALFMRAGQEDIFLESASSVGPDPFTDTAVTEAASPTTTPGDTTPGATTTTALFGGTGDQKVCDPEALITFLQANTDKAEAFIQALNSDETLQWSGNRALTTADIPTYIRELTPTFLTEDTRVTNHGFRDGRATPRQSVLQEGTAVLVDDAGIPRVRCACGNPLLPPEKVDTPKYKGPCWHDTTTTTSTSTTTSSSSSTSTSSSTTTTLQSSTPAALGPDRLRLALARPSNRCGDDPYCSPPGCFASTTTTTTPDGTTTTTPTPGPTRTTLRPRPTSTRPPTVPTRPPTVTTQPPATTVPQTTLPTTATTNPAPQ